MRRPAVGAIAAQVTQAGISFVLQLLVVRLLGVAELGRFAILYGIVVVATGVITGFVGDSLVVLERHRVPVRSALQTAAVGLSLVAGAAAAAIVAAIGLTTPGEAVAFAAMSFAFTLEEVLRRLLMAHLAFFRVVAADGSGFVVACSIILGLRLGHALSLTGVMVAIALGQLAALVVAARLLPREERWLSPPFRAGAVRELARYGTWRGLQQLLRPGLLTLLRSVLGAAAGLTAVGMLETARIYVAPALLVIGGFTSFLFVRYARDRGTERRRDADRTVVLLLGGTLVMGVIAVVLLPVLGPLLFGTTPALPAVLAWIAYTASVAAVTPYGSLAAVSGRQVRVFVIRLIDTVVSAAAAVVALAAGAAASTLPLYLVIGSVGGGLVLRFWVLRRPPTAHAAPGPEPQPETSAG